MIISIIIWGCRSATVTSSVDAYSTEFFHSGWSQEIDGELVALDDIQDFIPVEAGEELIFTCTLPEIKDAYAFLFYSIHKEVLCYVDDELVQDFTINDDYSILNTPGSVWNQVDLNSHMSGKTCTLIFNSPLGNYDHLCNIYLVEDEYIDTVRFGVLWPTGLSALGLFLVATVIIFVSIFERMPHRKRYLFSLSRYFFVVLLWLLAKLNFFDIFLSRPIISFMLMEVFQRMMPIFLLSLARNSTNQYWHPRIFAGVTALAWLNLFLPILLQFTLGISLLDTTIFNNIISAIIFGALFVIICEKYFNNKQLNYEEYPCLVLPILIIFSSIDNAIIFLNKMYHPYLGVWTAVGCIIFALATLILLTHINSCISKEREELESSCKSLENVALIKQLEAHFIFNSLNSISAYCKSDPASADKAITSFAAFLRSYLSLINKRENIPFLTELELVEQYLTIQQMRYSNDFSFVLDIDYYDFSVPPFIVHTFVENAIIHGIKTCRYDTTVTISSRREGDIIYISITDTGVGFDTSLPIKSSSFGLRNASKRLKLMRDGDVTISSTLGEGTTVEMSFPV